MYKDTSVLCAKMSLHLCTKLPLWKSTRNSRNPTNNGPMYRVDKDLYQVNETIRNQPSQVLLRYGMTAFPPRRIFAVWWNFLESADLKFRVWFSDWKVESSQKFTPSRKSQKSFVCSLVFYDRTDSAVARKLKKS